MWLGVLSLFGDVNMYFNMEVNPVKVTNRMIVFRTIRVTQNQTGARSCCVVDPVLLQVELLLFIVQYAASLTKKCLQFLSHSTLLGIVLLNASMVHDFHKSEMKIMFPLFEKL